MSTRRFWSFHVTILVELIFNSQSFIFRIIQIIILVVIILRFLILLVNLIMIIVLIVIIKIIIIFVTIVIFITIFILELVLNSFALRSMNIVFASCIRLVFFLVLYNYFTCDISIANSLMVADSSLFSERDWFMFKMISTNSIHVS